METGWKPGVEISPNCPRCGSSNTKFCYYNNYSLTQPRYFCKGCRRYWTKGGSLRNVPVGGGCRKNRRSKSLIRLPTDGDIPSKSLSSGVVSYYDDKVNPLPDQSNSSSSTSDGSHIDLAVVFANFLNNQQQQPAENRSDFEVPDLPTEFDPSLEFTNMESSDLQLPEENGVIRSLGHSDLSIESHLNNNDQIYYSGLESVHHKHQDGVVVQQCTGHETSNYAVLPPLPGDDLSSQELLWPSSLQATQEPVLGHETHDPNLMFGNWSPFDLSSDHDTFTRI